MLVTYKSWLGKVVGQSFREVWKRFWNKYSTEGDGGYIGYATKKLVNFPFEGLQSMLINVYNKFYWITADLIHQMGCNIGDSSMIKIDESLDKALDYVRTKVAEAQEYIKTNLIKPVEDKLKELEPYVDDLLDRVKTAETTIKNAQNKVNQALTDVAGLKDNVASINQDVNNFKANVDETISDFQSKMNKLGISIDDFEIRVSDAIERVKNAEALLSSFGIRLTETDDVSKSHTYTINDLIARVEALEKGTKPFELPTFELKLP